MVIRSETAFWIIVVACMVAAVVTLLFGALCGAAGYTILRDRGYGTIRCAIGVTALMIVIPAVLVWLFFRAKFGAPSPPTDVTPVLAVAIGAALVAVVGVLCWAGARAARRAPRRDGGPQRVFRYRTWGVIIGWATLPLAVVFWSLDGWSLALRVPLMTVPVMFLLFVFQTRADNRLNDETDLGPFVLSLRGFADDLRLTIRADPTETHWAETGNRRYVNLEQFLSDAVGDKIAKMIAFGSPRDKLPAGGAKRIYAPEASWREKVEKLAVLSQAIVMQIGESASLSDELAIIKCRGLAEKLFVVTGPANRSTTALVRGFYDLFSRLVGWPEPTWDGFAKLLRSHGFGVGAEDPGPGAVISFDAHLRRIDVRRGCRTPEEYATAIADRLAAR